MKNVYLEKVAVIISNIVDSLINVQLLFTAFDDFLLCYFILSFELNKTFDDTEPKKSSTFQSFFF